MSGGESMGPNTAAVAWLLWKLVRTADSSITYVVHAVWYSNFFLKNHKRFGITRGNSFSFFQVLV